MGKINSRKKGIQFELSTIKTCKDKGWDKACSSRSESKNLDDKGVDICYTDPFNIQCKAVERMTKGYHETLKSMPDDGNINVIFHKRNHKGVVVSMTEEDFWRLVNENK